MSLKESMNVIDKPTFFGSLGLLLLVTTPLLIWPEQGVVWVNIARESLVTNFGIGYMLLGLGSFLFMLFLAFSDVGKIRLGEPDSVPEFKTISWASMLFCAGIGIGIMYWSMIEWVYYYSSPPFKIEAKTEEALNWASTYSLFHWGPIAWSIYLVPAVPIAYFYHVRNGRALKLSEAVAPVIGEQRVRGAWGKLIDILFIFGMLGGGATSLGLGAPLLNEGLHELFGVPKNISVKICLLLLCAAIFGASAYAGIKKGIQRLSNINLALALILVLYVLLIGPTLFIFEVSFQSIGLLISGFFKMATYLEPFGGYSGSQDSSFPQDWTVFYWAWWLSFAPTIGLFIARISRGRTIGSMIIGTLFFGTVGCALFFMVLGNYAIWLQLSGSVDVVSVLNNQSPTVAIFAVLGTLPFEVGVIAIYVILTIIFLSTTFDSISYILASVVQTDVEDEPKRWNRLFWAGALSFLPVVLLVVGGLETLQTASIVGSAPLLIIALLLCISIYKVAHYDLKRAPSVDAKEIDLDEFPEHDPWSRRGSWGD